MIVPIKGEKSLFWQQESRKENTAEISIGSWLEMQFGSQSQKASKLDNTFEPINMSNLSPEICKNVVVHLSDQGILSLSFVSTHWFQNTLYGAKVREKIFMERFIEISASKNEKFNRLVNKAILKASSFLEMIQIVYVWIASARKSINVFDWLDKTKQVALIADEECFPDHLKAYINSCIIDLLKNSVCAEQYRGLRKQEIQSLSKDNPLNLTQTYTEHYNKPILWIEPNELSQILEKLNLGKDEKWGLIDDMLQYDADTFIETGGYKKAFSLIDNYAPSEEIKKDKKLFFLELLIEEGGYLDSTLLLDESFFITLDSLIPESQDRILVLNDLFYNCVPCSNEISLLKGYISKLSKEFYDVESLVSCSLLRILIETFEILFQLNIQNKHLGHELFLIVRRVLWIFNPKDQNDLKSSIYQRIVRYLEHLIYKIRGREDANLIIPRALFLRNDLAMLNVRGR